MSMSKTKNAAIKEMEKAGMGFTANVILNGCGKPVTKMKTILALIAMGCDVRAAQFETCQIVVNGKALWLGELDGGLEPLMGKVLS